jgi:hypothetical protein
MKPNLPRFQTFFNRLRYLDPRIGVILLVASIFLIAGTASTNSTHTRTQLATSTPVAQEITPELQLTPSPFPPELLENGNQTIGLSIAASIIVLIVIIGVVNAMLRSSPGDR